MARWQRTDGEERLAEEDVREVHQTLSRCLALFRGGGAGGAEPGGGEAGSLPSLVLYTLADLTSSLTGGLRPSPSSKAWPALLGVARELRQELDPDPPTPPGVDPGTQAKLKMSLSNFLAKVEKVESAARGEGLQDGQKVVGEEDVDIFDNSKRGDALDGQSGRGRQDERSKVKTSGHETRTRRRLVLGAIFAVVVAFFSYRCLFKE